jgi:hypothetical protein
VISRTAPVRALTCRVCRWIASLLSHTKDVTGLAFIFSCSGLEAERGMLDRLLVSGGMDGKLALWDTRPELAAGAQQQALQGQTEPTAEASPGGVVSPLYEIDLGVGPSPSTPAPLLQAPGGGGDRGVESSRVRVPVRLALGTVSDAGLAAKARERET